MFAKKTGKNTKWVARNLEFGRCNATKILLSLLTHFTNPRPLKLKSLDWLHFNTAT
jgi:hypothetical protein